MQWIINLLHAQKNARDLEALRDELRDWHQRINWELEEVDKKQEQVRKSDGDECEFLLGRRCELRDASNHLGVNLDRLINPGQQ